jgi:uncharacterized protein (TIGR02466 family)
MKTIELFTTPLFHCNIDSTRELLPKLEEYALHQEKFKSIKNVSNVGGHQTPFTPVEDEPLYEDLIDRLVPEIKRVILEWNFDDNLQIHIGRCWININRKGHLNMPHTHSKVDFAGIYYIKSGEETPIGFFNPDIQVKQEKFERCIENNAWNSPHYMHYPKENDFIMFPGHIEHWVEPNWSDTPRISLAFNIKIF